MPKRLESRLARLESRMQATAEVVTIVVVEDKEWYPVRAERIRLLNDPEALDRIRLEALREDDPEGYAKTGPT